MAAKEGGKVVVRQSNPIGGWGVLELTVFYSGINSFWTNMETWYPQLTRRHLKSCPSFYSSKQQRHSECAVALLRNETTLLKLFYFTYRLHSIENLFSRPSSWQLPIECTVALLRYKTILLKWLAGFYITSGLHCLENTFFETVQLTTAHWM